MKNKVKVTQGSVWWLEGTQGKNRYAHDSKGSKTNIKQSVELMFGPDFSEYFNIGFKSILTCWFDFWPLFEPEIPGLPQKLIWNLEILIKLTCAISQVFLLVLKMEEKTCEIVSCQFC